MPKNPRTRVDDARTFGTAVRRQLQTAEAGFRVGARPGDLGGSASPPRAVLRLPITPRDVGVPGHPGPGIHLFDPYRCAALVAEGVDLEEARQRAELTPAEIAAYKFPVDPDDDVGDEPPRFDDASVTAPEAGQ